MKKYILLCSACILLLTGCINKNEKDVYNNFKNTVEKSKGYHLTGTLELVSNETVYNYDIDVSYKEKDYFRVSLKNKTNNHEQIVLRNDSGVYVITPSLNKSFKFQSEWPYNNSQSYLLQTILMDLENDNERTYEETKDYYIFTSKVNYTNNEELINQKVYIDKNNKINKVEVLDKNNNVKIKVEFKDVDLKSVYNDDYFELDKNTSSKIDETTSNMKDIIYPMYIPLNTNLSNQETIKTETGERVILTFEGESPFMFIQENIKTSDNLDITPVNGEPVLIGDTVAAMTDYSVNWFNNGVEYYVVSNILDGKKLLEVAKSIGSVPTIK